MPTIKCLIIDDEPYARQLIADYAARIPFLEVVAICKGAWEVPEYLQKEAVDLLLLDIEMPEWDGLSFLRTWSTAPKAILITAHRDYAVQAFDLEVVDYLLKPVSFERFMKAIYRYQKIFGYPAGNEPDKFQEAIFLKANRQMVRLSLSEIMYVEVIGDYVKVIRENKETLISKITLKELLSRLPKSFFLQVHRSYIVAKKKVSAFTSDKIKVGEKWITISRPYKEMVRRELEK